MDGETQGRLTCWLRRARLWPIRHRYQGLAGLGAYLAAGDRQLAACQGRRTEGSITSRDARLRRRCSSRQAM